MYIRAMRVLHDQAAQSSMHGTKHVMHARRTPPAQHHLQRGLNGQYTNGTCIMMLNVIVRHECVSSCLSLTQPWFYSTLYRLQRPVPQSRQLLIAMIPMDGIEDLPAAHKEKLLETIERMQARDR